MAPDAYLKINRKMFDGLVESFPERLKKQVRILWWHLLWNANYMDNGKLKRGQIYASRQSLGDATMLSDRTIRTLLNRLKSDQPNANRFLKATNQTTNSATILTIVNYDGWVLAKDKCDQTSDQPKPESDQPSVRTRIEVKEIKEEKYMASNDDVVAVYDHFKRTINDKARLTRQGQDKIKTRLKVFSRSELVSAMDNISNDEFFQQHNATRPIAWFFHSDERIETYIHKVPQATNGRASTNACPGCKKELVTRQYPVGNPRVPPDLQGVPIVECGRCSYRRRVDEFVQ